jgi:hypothetical protein
MMMNMDISKITIFLKSERSKDFIDRVNLIKVHYAYFVNITAKPIAQLIYANKFLKF